MTFANQLAAATAAAAWVRRVVSKFVDCIGKCSTLFMIYEAKYFEIIKMKTKEKKN